MVRATGFLVTLSLSLVAAENRHGLLKLLWAGPESIDIATATSKTHLVEKPAHKTAKVFGQHKAYLQHATKTLPPTTLLTIATTNPTPSATDAPQTSLTTSQTLQRRQFGGLLGGLVSGLLGGIQPALTSALAPIQSAANTNLAQISLVKSLAPQVVPTANVIGPVATAVNPILGALLGNIVSAVAPIVSNIQGVVAQVAAPVESLASPIESAVLGPIQAAVAPLVSALAPAVAAALGPVGDAAGGLVNPVASNLLGPIESAVAPILGAVISNAVGAVGGIETPIADALRPVLDAVDDAILPLASAAVSAVWPAIAPIVTPLNPVICALQPAEVPIGGDATALIPVQCVSITSGNMIPVSAGVATVTSPYQGLLSITPAATAPPLISTGVPDRAALPIPGIPGLPVQSPLTTITAPVASSNPLASALGGLGSNPFASALAGLSLIPLASAPAGVSSDPLASALNGATSQLNSATGILGSIIAGAASNSPASVTGAAATNPLGAAAAAASSFLAGLGSASGFGVSIPLPTVFSPLSTANSSSVAAGSTSSVVAQLPSPLPASPTNIVSTSTAKGNVMTFAGAVTGVLTALPVVVPASAQVGNLGTITRPTSANLPNIEFPGPNPQVPASPLPISNTIAPENLPPAGGTIPTSTPAVTPAPAALQGGLIMLAFGTQTVTFAASELPGGELVASMSGNIFAFPATTPVAVPGKRRRDVTQPDYEALAMALVSLLTQDLSKDNQSNSTTSQMIADEAVSVPAIIMSSSTDSLSSQSSEPSGSLSSDSSSATIATIATSDSSIENASTGIATSFASTSTESSLTSSTSSVDAAASGASLSIDSCPDINGTSYLSDGGSVYQIICGTNWIGRDIQPWRSTPKFDACVAQCDALNAAARNRPCAAALFVPDAPSTAANCYPKYSADDPTNATGGYTFQAAVLQSSGNVVDTGQGIPVSHAELPVVKAEVASNSTESTTNSGETLANSSLFVSTTTDTLSAAPSSNTLALATNATLDNLSSTDGSPTEISDGGSNGIVVVYGSGTNVVEPLLSTTLMLGAATNQPATQYFSTSSSDIGSALAKRSHKATSIQPTAYAKRAASPTASFLSSSLSSSTASTTLLFTTIETLQGGGTFTTVLVEDPGWLIRRAPTIPGNEDKSMVRPVTNDKAFWLIRDVRDTPGDGEVDDGKAGWLIRNAEQIAILNEAPIQGSSADVNRPDPAVSERSTMVADAQWLPTALLHGNQNWNPSPPTLAPTPNKTPHLWRRDDKLHVLSSTTTESLTLKDQAAWLSTAPTSKVDPQWIPTAPTIKVDPQWILGTSTVKAEPQWLPIAPAVKVDPQGLSTDIIVKTDPQWIPMTSTVELEPQWLPAAPTVKFDPQWLPTARLVSTNPQWESWASQPAQSEISKRTIEESSARSKSRETLRAVIPTKRQTSLAASNPNAYNPISNATGPNFALANNPLDANTGVLPSNATSEDLLSNLVNKPHLSRDGGKGGMIAGQHVFAFADTGVYTTKDDGTNGHYLGYAGSSVAIDVGKHGSYGNSLTLQDGVGEFADADGDLRGFVPLTIGETAFNEQALELGVKSRYAVWPESSFISLTANASIMYAPIVYDVVDGTTKSADFTYTGNTLLYVTIDDASGPIAERLVGRMFNASDVEWGCVGGIRSWGDSGVGGEDGMVYLFGNVRGGLLMARTNVTGIADISSYEYWSGTTWTSGALAPDSTAYVLEGSFMDVDIFYSPRHLTFIAVYMTIYGDSTVYWRYLDAPQALVPSYAGGDPDSDVVEAITKYRWSDEHVLLKMGAGLNGDYSYAMGTHLGYFGQNDILNGGEKMLLSWTSPTGQDPASRNSAFQIMNSVVTWD